MNDRPELKPTRSDLIAAQAALVARALRETPATVPMRGARSAEGDRKRLRALPAVAPGVAGAIPGTNPLDALLAKEAREENRRTKQ